MASKDESAAEVHHTAKVLAESHFAHSAYTIEGDLERLGAAALIARRGGHSPIVRAFAVGVVGATVLAVLAVVAAIVATVIS